MIQTTPHKANRAATSHAPLQKESIQPAAFSADQGDGSGVGVEVAGFGGVADDEEEGLLS